MTVDRVRQRTGAYGVAVAASSATTALIVLLSHYISIPNISLLYLPPILVTAVYFGTGPSLIAATLAVVEYDFFLLRPLFTLTIGRVEDILAFVVFLIVAVLTSQLAARARARTEAAQRRAAESTILYELGRALMSAEDIPSVLDVITQRIVAVFGVDRCAIFEPSTSGGQLQLAAETVRHGTRSRESEAALSWVYQQGTEVGLPADGASTGHRLYLPLKTADRVVGVMEIGRKQSGAALDPEESRLVTSFAAQAALVIARAHAEEQRRKLEVVQESDQLKSALLSAVSHDLRTPLASIKAAATSLLLPDSSWSTAEAAEILRTIDHEADRLNRLVGNLLDLSRIEAGVLRPVLDWYDIGEIVDMVLPRLRELSSEHPLSVAVAPNLPPVQVDRVRIEELIVNLVENAVRYAPPRTEVEIRAWQDERGLCIAVADHGRGVQEYQRRRIFETFYRGQQHSDRHPGTGLGLAICRGIAQAHGGVLGVEETPGGGATFILTLPSSLVGEVLRT